MSVVLTLPQQFGITAYIVLTGAIIYIPALDKLSFADPMDDCDKCLHLPTCPLFRLRDGQIDNRRIAKEDAASSPEKMSEKIQKKLLYSKVFKTCFYVIYRKNIVANCRCAHLNDCEMGQGDWKKLHAAIKCGCYKTTGRHEWSPSSCIDNPENQAKKWKKLPAEEANSQVTVDTFTTSRIKRVDNWRNAQAENQPDLQNE